MENLENEQNREEREPFSEYGELPVDAVEGEVLNEYAPQNSQPPKKILVKSLVCSIIYSVLLIIVSTLIFVFGETSIIGLVLAILLSVAFGVVMYIGGFYLIIIPLPIFNLGLYGCLRTNYSIGKKILLGLLDFALAALVFVVLFLLQ